MLNKIEKMSDEELSSTWKALGETTWFNDEMWDVDNGISMNDWASNIYAEMCHRGLPR